LILIKIYPNGIESRKKWGFDMQRYIEEFNNKCDNKLIKEFETIIVKQANSIAFKIYLSSVI